MSTCSLDRLSITLLSITLANKFSIYQLWQYPRTVSIGLGVLLPYRNRGKIFNYLNKVKMNYYINMWARPDMAPPRGIEPRSTGLESVVLPLH